MPHIHEKIDFTATALIIYQDKVLLRKHDKYGIWIGVGGHIELDENPNEAVIREAREEVGLNIQLISSKENSGMLNILTGDLQELIPPEYMNIHNVSPVHKHIDMLYFATSETDNVIPENTKDEWKWLTAKEIEQIKDEIPESTYKYSLKALMVAASNS